MITSFNPQQSQLRQRQSFGTGFSREAIDLGMAAGNKVPGKSGYMTHLQEELANDGRNLRLHVEELDTKRYLLLQQVRIKGGLLEVKKATVIASDHRGKGVLGDKNPRNVIGAVGEALLELTPKSIKKSAKNLNEGHPFTKYFVY